MKVTTDEGKIIIKDLGFNHNDHDILKRIEELERKVKLLEPLIKIDEQSRCGFCGSSDIRKAANCLPYIDSKIIRVFCYGCHREYYE